jgi:demethylmenaquinone methyltransferase/2-methoxy-6-polyprenyl-1,4-benzoquinol methylase
MLSKFYNNYSKSIPIFGKFIVGKSQPYEYLIDSIKKFHSQDELLEIIKKQNFINASYRSLSGGIVAIHSAWKV